MKNRLSFIIVPLVSIVLQVFSCYQQEAGYSKISPSLQEKLDGLAQISDSNQTHDIVVILDKDTVEPIRNISSEDIKYIARDLVHAAFIKADSKKIKELAKDNSVVSIEEDLPVRTNLLYATKQIGAREAWNEGYKGEYLGDTSSRIRIAVVDTGVNVDHYDLNTRIAVAVDCYNKTCTTSGQKDDHGHGTHVAGIILGDGASCDEAGDAAYFEFSDYLGQQASITSYFFPTQFNGAAVSDLAVQATWTGAAGTTAGVLFRTKEKAEEQEADYIAPGPQTGSITATGPGVTPTTSYTPPLTYSITAPAGATIIPYAFSIYTSDNTVLGDPFWVYVKTTVKGWGDAFPRMAGMSYGSQLVAVKALGPSGTGNISDIVRGLEYISSIAESENIVATNLSFSIGAGVNSAVINTAVHNLLEKGVAVSVSAGNDQENGYSISSPGTEPLAITVGAVNDLDQVTEYSSLGSPYQNPIKPDVLAPGGSRITKNYIASTKTLEDSIWNHLSDPSLKDPYILKVGTSQSAPFVTGLIGLMASKRSGEWIFNSAELPKLFKMLLCMSAYEVGAGESGKISTGNTRTAVSPGLPERAGGLKDRVEGYGRVCTQGAMSAFDSTGMSFTFDEGLGGQKSFIRKVYLSASKEYNYTMAVPAGTDFDLYLFDGLPDENGEPVLLASSAIKNNTVERIMDFIPSSDGYYYLVSKWISGSGSSAFVLASERARPTIPTEISSISVYRDVVSKQLIAKWKTNVPARELIQYGEDGGLGLESVNSEYLTDHEFRLNIDYGKNYYIRMLSTSNGVSEADSSTAVSRVYKISTLTGRDSLVYDISPEDLPSLPAGGCGTIQDGNVNGRGNGSIYILLAPIIFLLFIRSRLRYSSSGGIRN